MWLHIGPIQKISKVHNIFTLDVNVCLIAFCFTDLGVITRAQIQFLARHKQNDATAANGTTPQKPGKYVLEHTAADQLKDMVAAAYDPVGKYVYVSDSNANAGSIFRIRTIGDAAYTVVEPVVASTFAVFKHL